MNIIEEVFYGRLSGLVDPISALSDLGLCHGYWGTDLLTHSHIETKVGRLRWKQTQLPEIDKENFVTKDPHYPNVVRPTAERALIDCIRMIDEVDEGQMVEAFGMYQTFGDLKNLPELYRVADFYKVPKDEVDYWLKEGYDDLKYC